MNQPPEVFTPDQHLQAVTLFLQYGEKTLVRAGTPQCSTLGHKGYFSNCGWAARALRSLRDHLKQPPVTRIIGEMRELSDEDRCRIIGAFCHHCGSVNPNCNCWNDE